MSNIENNINPPFENRNDDDEDDNHTLDDDDSTVGSQSTTRTANGRGGGSGLLGDDDEEEEDENMVKIRQKAFDLLHKTGGPAAEDSKRSWPKSPQKIAEQQQLKRQQQQEKLEQQKLEQQKLEQQRKQQEELRRQQQQQKVLQAGAPTFNSYQHQSAGEASSSSSTYPQKSYSSSSPPARQAEQLSAAELLVNCVSSVCQSTSSEIVQKGVSFLSSSYQTLSGRDDHGIAGTYQTVDTTSQPYGYYGQHQQQHYHGNSSSSNGYCAGYVQQGRYSD